MREAALAGAAVCLALGALGTFSGPAAAAPVPAPAPAAASDLAAARAAATSPATLATLSRFFARDGAVARSAAAPRAGGATVAVYVLSPDFVAGKKGAPVARSEFLATPAVSSDGQQASVWAADTGSGWQVVNIATGDDEFRYAKAGTAKLPGGTVFREPQTDAWYVTGGSRVLPLDEDAVRAVGAKGTTLAAYRARVAAAYGDKLPGSGYAKKGAAGGYGNPAQAAPAQPAPAQPAPAPAAPAQAAPGADGRAGSAGVAAAGAGGLTVLVLGGLAARRLRRSAREA
ncbi:hypothetical protein FQU76_06370 [Streptomyces qinzhouensis]|uniref:Uncharacterized protein n=1 Tax=Streptomyces qinzhouensis TaxID=2599401 RepID=A0A5B8JRZ6_9ACTN|nr:hypothetical protein FQU76_06370 [Streptomyces qinzhouensis]